MAEPNIATNEQRSNAINFAYSFRPIYYFSRIFGFAPFTIMHDSNGTIQVPKIRAFDIVWLILSIFAQVLSPILFFRNEKYSIHHISLTILIRSDIIIIAVRTIFIILAIILEMSKRYKMVEILKKIIDFDEDVSEEMDIFWLSVLIIDFLPFYQLWF